MRWTYRQYSWNKAILWADLEAEAQAYEDALDEAEANKDKPRKRKRRKQATGDLFGAFGGKVLEDWTDAQWDALQLEGN